MKALIAYFSAGGVTKKVAEKLAEAVGGDLFENMQKLAPGAKVEAGERLKAGIGAADLKKWALKWVK